jgi:hypothetical protein
MIPGQLVKYSRPEAGEEALRFIVIENNGDRVFIESTEPPSGGLEPQELVAPEDICPA